MLLYYYLVNNCGSQGILPLPEWTVKIRPASQIQGYRHKG